MRASVAGPSTDDYAANEFNQSSRTGTEGYHGLMRRRASIGPIVLLAIALLGSCGGNDVTAPSSATPTTGTSGSTSGPLPLGQASASGVSCPAGSPAGSACTRIVVGCPSVTAASAVVRVTRPTTTAERGTVVLTTGGDGTRFTSGLSSFSSAMVARFTAEGVVVADLAWDAPGVWGGPQARTLACRAATALKWAYDTVHTGGRSRMFAAQGTSAGASQIAFAIAHYGVDFLDLANLGAGPPRCPPVVNCLADGQRGPEPLLVSDPPAVNRSPVLSYPNTIVRFFMGDQEPNFEIIADARAYHDVITSAKSYTIVPGTNHHIEDTQAGVDAFFFSVRSALR